MRPYFTERRAALAALACARLSAGDAPPLDWAAAAIDQGRLLQPQKPKLSPRRLRALHRLGYLREIAP